MCYNMHDDVTIFRCQGMYGMLRKCTTILSCMHNVNYMTYCIGTIMVRI